MSVQVVLQCNHCNEIRLIMIYSFAMLIVTIFENLAYEITLSKAIKVLHLLHFYNFRHTSDLFFSQDTRFHRHTCGIFIGYVKKCMIRKHEQDLGHKCPFYKDFGFNC